MQHDESLTILRSHEKVNSSNILRFLLKTDEYFRNQVIRVGQQYVWKPTLNQLEDYKEFVGMERPINVMVSTFDPKERLAYYEEIMNRSIQPVYEDEIRITIENDDRAVTGNGAVSKLQPLDNYIDLQVNNSIFRVICTK